MNKLINWLKESNRLKHLKVGIIMFIGLFIIQYVGITVIKNVTNIVVNDNYCDWFYYLFLLIV